MTMYLCVDLHDYTFVAADRQVSVGKNAAGTKQTHHSSKLIQTSKSICTGCGLQEVIQNTSVCFEEGNLDVQLIGQVKKKYPRELLNMTKAIIMPTRSKEGERIISIDFHEANPKPIVFIGGIMQGSSMINDQHRERFMSASSAFVKNHSTGVKKTDFQDFIKVVSEIFREVSDVTLEVSCEFDYSFQSAIGERFSNRLPV